LVHWLGYPTADDQWIDAEDLHAPEILQQYLDSIDRNSRPAAEPEQQRPPLPRPPSQRLPPSTPPPPPRNNDDLELKSQKREVQGHAPARASRIPEITM